jgi:ribosomal protein S18 acetylase RimI-like enzyme
MLAIEANLYEHPIFHAWPRTVAAYDGPDLLWTRTNIAQPIFNSVGRANLRDDSAIAELTSHGVPVLWWVGPSSRPSDLRERLVHHGFVHAGDNPGMAAPLSRIRLTASNITIERVRDLRAWNDVPQGSPERLALYEFAGDAFQHYIAFAEGVAVGSASLFIAGGAAGIYNVFTLPTHRTRGIGTALTSFALRDARERGCTLSVLQASPMSVALYRALGFEEVCTISHYVWQV